MKTLAALLALLVPFGCGRMAKKEGDAASKAAAATTAPATTGVDATTTAPPATTEAPASASASGSGSPSDPLAARKAAEAELFAACAAAGAKAPAPLDTIASFLTYVNALPRPLSVPCLLASFPRPLALTGAYSPASAQFSPDPRTPRLFLQFGTMIITLSTASVAEGDNETVEMSELLGDLSTSVKAELVFPLAGAVGEAEAYDHMLVPATGKTTCDGCHFGDVPAGAGYPANAFKSAALRPGSGNITEKGTLAGIVAKCTEPFGETNRCAKIRASQYGGASVGYDFPAAMTPK